MALSALIIASIISAVAGLVGAGINYKSQQDTNSANRKLASDANLFNAEEAQKNRDWQTEMANTAHQREVADLQAAGLNPVLSANGGMASGVSSVSNANANVSRNVAPQVDFSGISSAVNALTTNMLISKRLDLLEGRNDILSDRNDIIAAKRMASNAGIQSYHSAKATYEAPKAKLTPKDLADRMTPKEKKEWERMMKELMKDNDDNFF